MSKSLKLALRKVIAAVDNLNNRNSNATAVDDLDEVNTLLDNALSELQWNELTKAPIFPTPQSESETAPKDEKLIKVLKDAYLALAPISSKEERDRVRNSIAELIAERRWF